MTIASEFLGSIPERMTSRLSRAGRGLIASIFQGLPLFHREMLEQSHRGRTFVLRASFACALFLVALFYSSASSGTSLLATAFGISGQGRSIMDALVWMLFLAIYLFGPALACGALTAEKERDTLRLLYLTKLGPWQVVLEKFLSRVVPLIGLLFLAFPLLAFAYAFGGVTRNMISTVMWFLLLSAIQVTAVAVMCSAICRSTAKSFLTTYTVLFLLSFGFDIADHWVFHDLGWKGMEQWETDGWKPPRSQFLSKTYEIQTTIISGPLSTNKMQLQRAAYVNLLCGPILCSNYVFESSTWAEYTNAYVTLFYRQLPIAFNPVTLAGIPILLSAIVCLTLARVFVFHHVTASVPGVRLRGVAWNFFRFGRIHHPDNSNRTRRISTNAIPGDGLPIAWRESARGFWGRPGNTIWLLVLIEFPTIGVLMALKSTASALPVSQLILSLWGLSTLLITVHASMLINKERSRQTLELLLTTPLTSAEIARQKFAGTRRLIILCAVPLLTCIAFQAWWRGVLPIPARIPSAQMFNRVEYFLTAAACVGIYLPVVAWIALWMGMRYQNATKATMAAIGAISVFCVAALVLLMMTLSLVAPVRAVGGMEILPLIVTSTSPVAMLYATEFLPLQSLSSIPYLPVILNIGVYGIVYWTVRGKVLERADLFLGRKVHY
ncbi:MAG: gliding motility-associated transporter permease protein [Planctomycetaceae bacterium]|nr:gliding motility-associated transporter permease protein [Planctomycetaceae bacterium]